MNNYLKIFLTIVILTISILSLSLGYYFLRMSDTLFNIGGVLLITAISLGAYWCFYQMWIKPIPKDATLFGNKAEEKKEEKQ